MVERSNAVGNPRFEEQIGFIRKIGFPSQTDCGQDEDQGKQEPENGAEGCQFQSFVVEFRLKSKRDSPLLFRGICSKPRAPIVPGHARDALRNAMFQREVQPNPNQKSSS